jgi:CheY-like chemotaxis protein
MKTNSLVEKNNCDSRSLIRPAGELGKDIDFEHIVEWVRLDVAYVRKDATCMERHQQNLRKRGEMEERLNGLNHWRESSAFTEREKAALSISETISLHEPEEESHRVLQEARRYFEIEEIVRLMLSVMAVNEWIDLFAKSSIRVLVVEDNPLDQELLLRQLRMAHLADNVLFMPDAFKALQWLECSRDSSESELIAIFLDIRLPGISGIELLQRLRTMPGLENFPVIVMTSSNDPRDMEECKRLKVMGYVEKPVTYNSFSKAVADIFHQTQGAKVA